MSWYQDALRLLKATVEALAVRPGGVALIDRALAEEPNGVLVDAIEQWSSEATTTHER